MARASSLHEAGHPRPVLWNNPEGYGGKGGGRGFRMGGGHMYTCGQFIMIGGKNHQKNKIYNQ